MDNYILFWLVAAVLFIVVELVSIGLTSIWFAAGALSALLVAVLHGNIIIQVAVFLIVSVVLLCMTRPWARKYINSRTQKTNVDSLIGEKTILTETVNNLEATGRAVVLGKEWTVRAKNENDIIESGALVKVVEISGVKLLVERFKED